MRKKCIESPSISIFVQKSFSFLQIRNMMNTNQSMHNQKPHFFPRRISRDSSPPNGKPYLEMANSMGLFKPNK